MEQTRGFLNWQESLRSAQALEMKLTHMEFYAQTKKAMVSTMSELFGIVETEEQRVKKLER